MKFSAAYDDMTHLWHGESQRMQYASAKELDFYTAGNAGFYHRVVKADRMALSFDIGRDLWLTKARFPKLQRDYLPTDGLVLNFLQNAESIYDGKWKKGATAQLSCRVARNSKGDLLHQWGNCMLGMGFYGGPDADRPATFTLHSRTSFISYLGPLDMLVVWVIATELSDRLDMNVEDFQFIWYADSFQWHPFKCAMYSVTQYDLNAKDNTVADVCSEIQGDYPIVKWTNKHVNYWWDCYENDVPANDLSVIKYAQMQRYVKRFYLWADETYMPIVRSENQRLLPQFLEGESIGITPQR